MSFKKIKWEIIFFYIHTFTIFLCLFLSIEPTLHMVSSLFNVKHLAFVMVQFCWLRIVSAFIDLKCLHCTYSFKNIYSLDIEYRVENFGFFLSALARCRFIVFWSPLFLIESSHHSYHHSLL